MFTLVGFQWWYKMSFDLRFNNPQTGEVTHWDDWIIYLSSLIIPVRLCPTRYGHIVCIPIVIYFFFWKINNTISQGPKIVCVDRRMRKWWKQRPKGIYLKIYTLSLYIIFKNLIFTSNYTNLYYSEDNL